MEPTATPISEQPVQPTTAARKPPELPITATPEQPVQSTSAATESPDSPATTSPPDGPPPDYWQVYADDARGLLISYPPEWAFFDPTKTLLTEFIEKLGEKANSDEIRELLETFTQTIQQEDLFVGLGFQFLTGDSRDTRFVNNINIISFHTESLSLQLIAQMIRCPVKQHGRI